MWDVEGKRKPVDLAGDLRVEWGIVFLGPRGLLGPQNSYLCAQGGLKR